MGAVGSTGLPPGSPIGSWDNGLGLAALWRGSSRLIVGEEGFERLLARPKMSLAAEATVQADPPFREVRFRVRTAPGGANGSGPPIPAAPVRVETSEAIVTNSLQTRSRLPKALPSANCSCFPS